MAEKTSDLEIFREAFMHQLTQAQPDMSGYQDFLRYWKSVEAEAAQVEDLGKLDEWVREIARDKERVAALKNRTDMMGHEAAATIAPILKMVLDMLDAIERRLKRIRNERMGDLAALLWSGGPGTGTKAKPEEKKDKDGKKKADGGADAPEMEVPAAQQKPVPVKKDKEKKMER